MWARVKLNRQKIMENYFKSFRSNPSNVFFSKGVHFFQEHIWETASGVSLRDYFWKNGEIVEK